MKIRSSFFVVALASVLIASCAKQVNKPSEDTLKVTGDPRDPIVQAIKALNAQDTAAYAKTLNQTQLKFFRENAAAITRGISLLKGETLTPNIISSRLDSTTKNVGFVKFSVTADGPVKVTGDTIEQQVFFEDGAWRQQWIFAALRPIMQAVEPKQK